MFSICTGEDEEVAVDLTQVAKKRQGIKIGKKTKKELEEGRRRRGREGVNGRNGNGNRKRALTGAVLPARETSVISVLLLGPLCVPLLNDCLID